jgi:Holliday junction resolvase
MMQTTVEIERKRLVEIAREYRKLGYEVILEPKRSQLPEFLASFQPDMLAKNNIETVVVEVKSRETLSQSAHMAALASVIQQHEGWRFELVVTNPREKSARIRIQDINDLLTTQDIIYRLNEARTLSNKEYGEAAFLLAWSATEATLRRAASQHRISAARYQATPTTGGADVAGVGRFFFTVMRSYRFRRANALRKASSLSERGSCFAALSMTEITAFLMRYCQASYPHSPTRTSRAAATARCTASASRP